MSKKQITYYVPCLWRVKGYHLVQAASIADVRKAVESYDYLEEAHPLHVLDELPPPSQEETNGDYDVYGGARIRRATAQEVKHAKVVAAGEERERKALALLRELAAWDTTRDNGMDKIEVFDSFREDAAKIVGGA